MSKPVRIHSFMVVIEGPDVEHYESPQEFDEMNQNVVDMFTSLTTSDLRDHINDLLPEEFGCRIVY